MKAHARPTAVRMTPGVFLRHGCGCLQQAGALMATVIVISAGSGCSVSASSESISKSVSSPFTASSRSSSPDDADREDVSDLTAAQAQSGGSVVVLRRRIRALAAQQGITDWERSEATYRGVGEGLAKAGYRQIQLDAFKTNFAQTDEQAKWLQTGYDSAH